MDYEGETILRRATVEPGEIPVQVEVAAVA
jgi:hypothetical protein